MFTLASLLANFLNNLRIFLHNSIHLPAENRKQQTILFNSIIYKSKKTQSQPRLSQYQLDSKLFLS